MISKLKWGIKVLRSPPPANNIDSGMSKFTAFKQNEIVNEGYR